MPVNAINKSYKSVHFSGQIRAFVRLYRHTGGQYGKKELFADAVDYVNLPAIKAWLYTMME